MIVYERSIINTVAKNAVVLIVVENTAAAAAVVENIVVVAVADLLDELAAEKVDKVAV
jgi:hypothetical protein